MEHTTSIGWQHTLILSLAVGFWATTPIWGADITIERHNSQLKIDIPSDQPGEWRLEDDAGHVCVSGSQQHMNWDKVASDTDLVFHHNGTPYRIPAQKHISPLGKVGRAARIYQLPIRTYTARDRGYDHRGSFDAVTDDVLRDIRDLGIDYIWLTGALEQASSDTVDVDGIKGEAGSYYAIYDAWDASPQLGGLAALERLIARAHDAGIRVLIDLVPNHTARVHQTDVICKESLNFGSQDDRTKFFSLDNNYYYIQGSTFVAPMQETAGADGVFDSDIATQGLQLESPAKVTGNNIVSPTPIYDDWFETVKLNYGFDLSAQVRRQGEQPRTWAQVFDVAQYWVNKGVDGFRVDFAHLVPLDFWHWFVRELRQVQPDVFLVAEAYEGAGEDSFRYKQLFEAGFDSIYHSYLYWRMHEIAKDPGHMRVGSPSRSPLMRPEHVATGDMFTHYMENHDELRLASRFFTPSLVSRETRAALGLAYTTYLGLLPGHLLIHGGQEVQEDASVFGPFAGENGRTSIFDWVHQPLTRMWLDGARPDWMVHFRSRYQRLLALKAQVPFSLPHSAAVPTLYDLDQANWYKDQSKWIGAYVRVDPATDSAYLVVTNSDPRGGHEATIHFTSERDRDPIGVLAAIGVEPTDQRILFVEEFSRPGWIPEDPNIEGRGIPSNLLFRPGGVPSGLYLGEIPSGTTYVFKISRL